MFFLIKVSIECAFYEITSYTRRCLWKESVCRWWWVETPNPSVLPFPYSPLHPSYRLFTLFSVSNVPSPSMSFFICSFLSRFLCLSTCFLFCLTFALFLLLSVVFMLTPFLSPSTCRLADSVLACCVLWSRLELTVLTGNGVLWFFYISLAVSLLLLVLQ